MKTIPESARPAPARPSSTIWKRAGVLLLLCAAVALVASSEGMHGWLLRGITVASELMTERPVLGTALFVLLAALSAMLAFFSSAVLVPVAVYTWGRTAAMFLLWLGWTLGGFASYGIGRFLGRPVVRTLLSGGTLARYEDRISKHSSFGRVLLLQLALPSEVPGYLLGLVRYRFWKYALALMLVELPYAVGTIYLGVGFLERRLPLLLVLGAAGVLLMIFAFTVLHRRLGAESQSRGAPVSEGDSIAARPNSDNLRPRR